MEQNKHTYYYDNNEIKNPNEQKNQNKVINTEDWNEIASESAYKYRNEGESVYNENYMKNIKENIEEFAEEALDESEAVINKAKLKTESFKDKLEEFASDCADTIKKVGKNIAEASKNVIEKTKEKISELTKKNDNNN
ncbi:MAG: hypothetical protein GX490_02385 [Bacilli bacterium]|nr:hypothetical protein [Bacilli bacterium]